MSELMSLDNEVTRPHGNEAVVQLEAIVKEMKDREDQRRFKANIVCWKPWDFGAVLALLPYLAVLLLVIGVAVFR